MHSASFLWLSYAAPLLAATETSEDKHKQCSYWGDQGDCVSDADWMNRNCHGTCTRLASMCLSWAKDGECESNPTFMYRSCAAECAQVGAPEEAGTGAGIQESQRQIPCRMPADHLNVASKGHWKRRAGVDLGRRQCPLHTCPALRQKSANDQHGELEAYYDGTNGCVYADGGAPLASLLNGTCRSYEGWTWGYPDMREDWRPWKEAAFLPHVRPGDVLYESACGIGVNMLATAEILREHGVTGLTFHGNDYSARSVATANRFWDDPLVRALDAHKGRICRADSSDLVGVPDGAFDLAWTGYLEPRQNPLGLAADDDGSPSSASYCASDPRPAAADDVTWRASYCKTDRRLATWEQAMKSVSRCTSDPHLAAREQAAQEDWLASWVTELVRITRPGGHVAIESIGESWCTKLDWGGVDRDWWSPATIARYRWDIDPQSIFVMGMARRRYNVLLRKIGP